jgi:hypothetical protein
MGARVSGDSKKGLAQIGQGVDSYGTAPPSRA